MHSYTRFYIREDKNLRATIFCRHLLPCLLTSKLTFKLISHDVLSGKQNACLTFSQWSQDQMLTSQNSKPEHWGRGRKKANAEAIVVSSQKWIHLRSSWNQFTFWCSSSICQPAVTRTRYDNSNRNNSWWDSITYRSILSMAETSGRGNKHFPEVEFF